MRKQTVANILLNYGRFLWPVRLLGTHSQYPFTAFQTLRFLNVILSLIFITFILVLNVMCVIFFTV